jgi:superfamily II RNA helicase
MYTTLNNIFHINSFKKLIDSTEYGIACNVHTTKIAKKDITSAYEKNKLHNVLNTSYSINESGTLWKKIKAKTITLQTFNQTKKEDTLNANNSLFSNTSGFYPIHKDFKNITDTLMVYINDSQQNPVSILASYLNEQVSILGDNVVTTTGDVALNIHVGDKMLLEVTKNALSQFPEISEITNPYIIMANELIYQKNTLTQVVTYARDMISSTIKTNI